MNVLILNWRDIKNPASGGAEILTYEIAKYLVKHGVNVTWFTSGYKGSRDNEVVDGISIIRKGDWWSVHVYAVFYYFKELRKTTDVIIDEVHWFPFFSRIYAKNKTILLACEVAKNLFFNVFPFPVSYLFRMIEKIYLLIYRNSKVLAISPSTKNDLVMERFKSRNIHVLPMGLSVPKNTKKYSKEKNITFISVGRLNKQKGSEDLLNTFAEIKKTIYNSKLWIIGSANDSYMQRLKDLAKKLRIEKDVKFFGYVPEMKKFEYMSKAHILLVPSVHEGWGLTVQEAAYCGTPAVVYNVSGLRDTVINNKTGLIIRYNTPASMAAGAISILEKQEYKRISNNCKAHAKSLSWEITGRQTLKILMNFGR